MNLRNIFISEHALHRFCERWPKHTGQEVEGKPEDFVIKKFSGDLKEIMGQQAENLKSQARESGRFFCYGSWIFVTDNELTVVITIFYKQPSWRFG